MNHSKVTFENDDGDELSGYLELPINREAHNYVLFSHCFTCNKNFFAVKNISTTLAKRGFGVLRFDFTGLGESEGDFADSNFSGNVNDLLAAARFLKENYRAPSLLIGHSLGGAATVFAAQELPSVKAIAAIAAPSSPKHVTHLLKSDLEEIKEKGHAVVNIGGRDFTIKEQFLKDLKEKDLLEVVREMEHALLLLHAPQDDVVEVKNAEEIYLAARHPKSYISLDGADHLLSREQDSVYVGEVISAWSLKYLEFPERSIPETQEQVVANLGSESFTTEIKAGEHFFVADEPKSMGGNDFGPTPYELISAALAACTSMTIQMYTRKKQWPLKNVETHVNYARSHGEDCKDCNKDSSRIDTFERLIVVEGDLDEFQRKKILEIANKCPVHRTLEQKAKIKTQYKND